MHDLASLSEEGEAAIIVVMKPNYRWIAAVVDSYRPEDRAAESKNVVVINRPKNGRKMVKAGPEKKKRGSDSGMDKSR